MICNWLLKFNIVLFQTLCPRLRFVKSVITIFPKSLELLSNLLSIPFKTFNSLLKLGTMVLKISDLLIAVLDRRVASLRFLAANANSFFEVENPLFVLFHLE